LLATKRNDRLTSVVPELLLYLLNFFSDAFFSYDLSFKDTLFVLRLYTLNAGLDSLVTGFERVGVLRTIPCSLQDGSDFGERLVVLCPSYNDGSDCRVISLTLRISRNITSSGASSALEVGMAFALAFALFGVLKTVSANACKAVSTASATKILPAWLY